LINHSWSDDDNLIAYYLYRFGDSDLSINKKELGDILGMGPDSLSIKISNFRAIDGQGGLDGYSAKAVQVFKQYHVLPDKQVKVAAEEAILRSMEKHVAELKMHIKPL